MSITSFTMKAYWRESPEPHACTTCKASGVRTWQTGHKPRRSRQIEWWQESHLCDECKAELPHTPPPLDQEKPLAREIYIIHPGDIISPSDGQRHRIGYARLCELYGVNPRRCINYDSPEAMRGIRPADFIHLHPRDSGNYQLPTDH